MAGSISFAMDKGQDGQATYGGLRRLTAVWTTDGTGGAVGTTEKIVGRLIKAITVPGNSPTDNYSIAITDDLSVNVLASCKSNLTNRDTTNTEEAYFVLLSVDSSPLSMPLHPAVCSPLTITVSSAGTSKTGTIYLFYQPAA